MKSQNVLIGCLACVLILLLANCSAPPQDKKSKKTEQPASSIDTIIDHRAFHTINNWSSFENILNEQLPITPQPNPSTAPKLLLDTKGRISLFWHSLLPVSLNLSPFGDLNFKFRNTYTDPWTIDSQPLPSYAEFWQVGHDPDNGNIFLLWSNKSDLYLSVFAESTGWKSAIFIASLWTQDPVEIQQSHEVVSKIDFNGNYLITISQSTERQNSIFLYTKYVKDVGLTPVSQFSYSDINITNPNFPFPFGSNHKVVTDILGNSYIFWLQTETVDGYPKSIWWNKFDGTIWSTPEKLVESSYFTKKLHPVIDTRSGQIELIFFSEMNNTIYSKSYNNGVWSNHTPLSTTNSSISFNIDSNYNGDAMIVWEQDIFNIDSTLNFSTIKAKHYSPTTGWSASDSIGDITLSNIVNPKIRINQNNNALASWLESNDDNILNLFTNQFNNSIGWENRILLNQYLTNPLYSSDFYQWFDIELNNQNYGNIIWEEVTKNPDTFEFNVYSSTLKIDDTPTPLPISQVDNPGIVPASSWKNPVAIFSSVISTNNFTNSNGPLLNFFDENNAFILAERMLNTNPSNYFIFDNKIIQSGIIHLTTGFTATEFLPQENLNKSLVTELQSNSINQGLFTLIKDFDGNRKVSYPLADGSWKSTIALGKYDYSLSDILKPLPDGRVLNFWQTAHYGPFNALLTNPISPNPSLIDSSATSFNRIMTPFSTLHDEVIVSILLEDDETGDHRLSLIDYVINSGWKTPTLPIYYPSQRENFVVNGFATSKNRNIFVVVSNILSGNIYANYFNTIEQWHDWFNIDENVMKNMSNIGPPQVVSNHRGDMGVFWIQEYVKNNGDIAKGIYYSQLIDTISGTSPTWSTPMFVSSIQGPNKLLKIKSVMNESGNIVLTWVDRINSNSILKTMQYNPATGWDTNAEQIVTYDGLNSGSISNYNLSINSTNNVIVTWDQIFSLGDFASVVTWYTQKQ